VRNKETKVVSASGKKRKKSSKRVKRRKEQPVYLVQVWAKKLLWREGFIPLLIYWDSLCCLFKVPIGVCYPPCW